MKSTNPFDDLIAAGNDGEPFDLDAFLRLLGGVIDDDRSPREDLDYAFEALTAAQKLGDPAAQTRALANFGSAMKRVREA